MTSLKRHWFCSAFYFLAIIAFLPSQLPWGKHSAIGALILACTTATMWVVLRRSGDDTQRRAGSPEWVLSMLLVVTILALNNIR
jgi:hypothetical protein